MATSKTTQRDGQAGSNLPKLSAPAHRALAGAGIGNLKQVSKHTEAEVKKLHGIGPNALKQLHAALAAKGLAFKGEKSKL